MRVRHQGPGPAAVIRHLVNIILWLLPPTRLFGLRRLLLRLGGIDVAADTSVCGRGWIYGRGRLSIGTGTWLSPGVEIHTHSEAAIVIAADCDIGPGVVILTGSHEIGTSARRAGTGTARPVAIGPGCWIGARSLILGGVTIGAGSIVAAGAVVVADCPANALIGGIPARQRNKRLA